MRHDGPTRAAPAFLLAAVAAVAAGCRQDPLVETPASQPPPAAAPASTTAPAPATAPAAERAATQRWAPQPDPKTARFLGLEGPKPATWREHRPSSTMRVAQYTVPGRDGASQAHVAVFHFGSGGTLESNLVRWQRQFRPAPDGTLQEPIIEGFTAGDGMEVTTVELTGEWMRSGTAWYVPDRTVINAIVETPAGKVFLQFAGPSATVAANRDAFAAFLRGLRPVAEEG